MKRRLAELPLHSGQAPAWLFRRMTQLAGAVTLAIVEEYGPAEMLRRLSDPWWFQAFGCVLGFDWHSSGVTTVTCGALKEAAKTHGRDLGLFIAGGKGATSRKTPQEIAEAADRHAVTGAERLIYASRMSAKVDSAAVQDGFDIYHHAFFFTPDGHWCVVQQGLNEDLGWARRYHWLGDRLDDFVCEPHAAIQDLSKDGEPAPSPRYSGERVGVRGESADAEVTLGPVPVDRDGVEARLGRSTLPPAAKRPAPTPALRQLELFPSANPPAAGSVTPHDRPPRDLLNMVAEEAGPNRNASAALVREKPGWLLQEIQRCTAGPTLCVPAHHPVLPRDVNLQRLNKLVVAAHEHHPQDFETLLGLRGVGPAAIRSLSLLAEIIFQAPASHRDPASTRQASTDAAPESRRWADYAYAHGGKDGTPFPVDRGTYDRNILVLTDAVRRAKLGENERFHALRRLAQVTTP